MRTTHRSRRSILASRAFTRLAASVGLVAHPHMLRHTLASAMAAEREPASIIAAQLRHADGGALAQRVYIHQLPQTAPRLAGVTRWAVGVGRASGGGKLERKPALKASLTGNAAAVSPQLKYGVAGTGFEPV